MAKTLNIFRELFMQAKCVSRLGQHRHICSKSAVEHVFVK